MYELSKPTKIKNLIVFQYPEAYDKIKEYVFDANVRKGVNIGELMINPYVYECRSMDLPFLIKYIESIDKLAGIFRDIYDETMYMLKINYQIDISNIDDNEFHKIFDRINNMFNVHLSDQFLLEDFSIYQSQTSIETIMALYEAFKDGILISLSDYMESTNILNLIITTSHLKYMSYIYDKIFEQFEYIYLPFY